ncbi:MAG: hypothetical protein P4M08_01570 [Oligoflexia bacterium]|nr:hypothetical protein [Oligoflexia bacterium]
MIITKNSLGKLAATAAIGLALVSFGCNNTSTGTNTWSIAGVTGPTVTYGTNLVTISAVLQNTTVSAGATLPIPSMPNSSIEVAPEVNGGLLFQASIDTQDVLALANANELNPTELPGGRPLPGVAGGDLPGFAVQIPALDNVTLYVSTSIFGVFVPIKFGLNQVIGTFNYFDKSGKLIGDISVVGEDANKQNSGALLLLDIGNVASSMAQQHKLKM